MLTLLDCLAEDPGALVDPPAFGASCGFLPGLEPGEGESFQGLAIGSEGFDELGGEKA